MNWYNYVGGDPVNFTDPLGLQAHEPQTFIIPVCPVDSCVTIQGPKLELPSPSRTIISPAGPAVSNGSREGGAGNGGEPQNGDDIVVTAIQYRGHYHDQVVKDLSSFMRSSGVPLVTELTICVIGRPLCARADIFGSDPKQGGLFVTEVKTGLNPRFTPGQLAVYPHLGRGGLVTSSDPRVTQFGLTPGAPFPPISGMFYYKKDASTPQIVIPF